jgi:multiple sugar transport system permease protein
VLYPLFWMIGTSFKSPEEIASNIGLIPHEFTPSNFSRGLAQVRCGLRPVLRQQRAGRTLTGARQHVSCLLAAYALGRLRFRMRGFWFAIMIGTLLLPGHVLIIPQYILFRTLGLVGGDFPYLPLLVPHFLATEAFFVFLMVQFMRGIPRELDEAAVIDGARRSASSARGAAAEPPGPGHHAIFSFIWTWNDFFRQLVYLSAAQGLHRAGGADPVHRLDQRELGRPDVRHVPALAGSGVPLLRGLPAAARRGHQHQRPEGVSSCRTTGATRCASPPTWRCSASW